MRALPTRKITLLTCLFTGMLVSASVMAEKPDWAGKDKSEKHIKKREEQKSHGQDMNGDGISVSFRFNERQRTVAREYFAGEARSGRCPPGLEKKNNGCLPPGQAKKWAVGKALPKDVVIYDLPSRVTVKLGIPPEGHKYVRVASDILLIAVGTAMVVDAIEDLHNM